MASAGTTARRLTAIPDRFAAQPGAAWLSQAEATSFKVTIRGGAASMG